MVAMPNESSKPTAAPQQGCSIDRVVITDI